MTDRNNRGGETENKRKRGERDQTATQTVEMPQKRTKKNIYWFGVN